MDRRKFLTGVSALAIAGPAITTTPLVLRTTIADGPVYGASPNMTATEVEMLTREWYKRMALAREDFVAFGISSFYLPNDPRELIT